MKKIIFLTLIVLFILFNTNTINASEIVIVNYPQSVFAGVSFDVSFQAGGLATQSGYFVKGLGGENFTKIDTYNSGGWFQQNASWTSMPSFAPDTQGSVSGQIKVKFDPLTSSGSQQFKLRIRNSVSEDNFDSSTIFINVITPTPSPTISPTTSPTKSPSPSSSPTKSPSPKPSLIPIQTPITTPTPTQLSALDPSPTVVLDNDVVIENKSLAIDKKLVKNISIFIMSIGLLICLWAGYLMYKIRYNRQNEEKN